MKTIFHNPLLLMTAVTAFTTAFGIAQGNQLGQFDSHGDIGNPKLAGSASYDAGNQEYTLTAAGTNMWFGRDQFHFAWKKLKGDFILRTRFAFEGKGVDAHRKVGWMVRPTLDAPVSVTATATAAVGMDHKAAALKPNSSAVIIGGESADMKALRDQIAKLQAQPRHGRHLDPPPAGAVA